MDSLLGYFHIVFSAVKTNSVSYLQHHERARTLHLVVLRRGDRDYFLVSKIKNGELAGVSETKPIGANAERDTVNLDRRIRNQKSFILRAHIGSVS